MYYYITCITILHVLLHYMYYYITCITTLHVLLYYMYYYITCMTILHVLLYYYRNRLKLYTEDINEHDTPQLEWVFI